MERAFDWPDRNKSPAYTGGQAGKWTHAARRDWGVRKQLQDRPTVTILWHFAAQLLTYYVTPSRPDFTFAA